MNREIGPKTARLIALLGEVVILFRKYQLERWADWLDRDRILLEASDARGITHLLEAYGGMGSILDVCFTGSETGLAAGTDRDLLNEDNTRLDRLLADIYDLAKAIEREIRSDTGRKIV